jgi:predicted RNA-binding Zn-ribbon protein involved in translation (DUF1610 family)
MAGATLIAPPERHAPSRPRDPRPTYGCPECGHVLRVSGLGRHRVLADIACTSSSVTSDLDEPVINRVCPACGRGLPGKNAVIT